MTETMNIFGELDRPDSVAPTGDRKYAVTTTLSRDARLLKLSAYVGGDGVSGTSQDLRGFVYDSAGTTLVGVTDTSSVDPGDAPEWRDFVFADPPEVLAGDFRLGLHAAADPGAQLYGTNGAGLKATDTYSDGTAATFGTSSAALAPAIFATLGIGWRAPFEEDAQYARYGFYTAQLVLGATGPVEPPMFRAVCGWHGTWLDDEPQGASFAIVQKDGKLADLVGERVQVRLSPPSRNVVVYIHREAELDTDEDISLSRRTFETLAPLATDSLAVVVEALAEAN